MYLAYITVGAIGHVMPTIPFVSELVKRGVRVRYFTTENMRDTIAFTGAEFSPVDTVLTDGGKAKDDIQVDFMAELPLRFLSEADCVVRQVIPELEKDRPDAIISDATAVAGRLVAKALDLPLIQVFTSYASNENFSVAAGFPPVPDTHPARVKARELAEDFTSRYGISHIGLKEIFEWKGDFNICTLSKDFQPAGDSFGEDYFFAGAQVGTRPDAGKWKAPEGDKPLIYASLGTLFNNWPEFYKMLFAAVKDMPVNLVASIGSSINPADLEPIPENVTVAAFQPQLEILPKADIFVSHCGTGSVMEAIYFGTPILGVPQMDEQFLSAARVKELGFGEFMPGREAVSEESLKAAIENILNNTGYALKAKELQEKMIASGGYIGVADNIIRFVESKK